MSGNAEEPTILIVDDNTHARKSVARLLKQKRYQTLGSGNGREALNLAKEHSPDLIVLDMNMPGMSGMDVLAEIRSSELTHEIPTIFVSGEHDQNIRVAALEAGAVDWIAKPAEPGELIARISTQLKLKQFYREKVTAQTELVVEQNKMIGMLAHDLRCPLNVILNTLELMDFGLTEEKKQEMRARAVERVGHMVILIDSLLAQTKKRRATISLDFSELDLQETLTPHLIDHYIRAEQKHISLRSTFPSGSTLVTTDKHRVLEVLDNLIGNAIKYSNSETEIHVTVDHDETHFIFEVSDQGLGIKAEELPHIFDDFNSLSNTPTAEETSTGLGLAIVKKIVGLLEGTISVESEYGQGSTFKVSLPKAPLEIKLN